jgi:hypothetical protein
MRYILPTSSSAGKGSCVLRSIAALVILLLTVAPALDLAWNEPTLDQSPGARCPLHATPGVICQPAGLIVVLAVERLLPDDVLDRLRLAGAPIFIPPRA